MKHYQTTQCLEHFFLLLNQKICCLNKTVVIHSYEFLPPVRMTLTVVCWRIVFYHLVLLTQRRFFSRALLFFGLIIQHSRSDVHETLANEWFRFIANVVGFWTPVWKVSAYSNRRQSVRRTMIQMLNCFIGHCQVCDNDWKCSIVFAA